MANQMAELLGENFKSFVLCFVTESCIKIGNETVESELDYWRRTLIFKFDVSASGEKGIRDERLERKIGFCARERACCDERREQVV